MTVDELVVMQVTALNRYCDTVEKYGMIPVVQGQQAAEVAPAAEVAEAKPAKANGAVKVEPPGPTIDDAMAIGKELAKLRGAAVVSNLVTSIHKSGKKVAELPPDKLKAFIAGCEVLIKKAQEEVAASEDDEI
jgi:hypothetical protein